MKPTALTQRRCRRQAGPGLSLFPFLAVLICTMGALVPLFLAIARQARLQAVRQSAAKAVQRQVDLKAEHELSQWRNDQLQVSRQKTEAQLSDARVQLGHLEDHSRRLRDQAANLQATCDELQKDGSAGHRRRSELQTDLEQVRTELARAERELGDAKRAAAERPRCFAVVPYEGPNQTHRLPIYIECRADAVVLQPEGIPLAEEDFEGPMGAGNPLAAALRATREYLISHGGFDPAKTGEAYPLLLVRPDGIAAYYAARTAMKSWGTEFGYELIDDDWKLAFPPPDPQLAQVVQEALRSARVRQQQLIAAAPRIYGTPPRSARRASPGIGGGIPNGGSRAEEDDGFRPSAAGGPIGSRYGAYGGGPAGAGYGPPGAQPAGDASGLLAAGPMPRRNGSPGGALADNPPASFGGGSGGNPEGSFGGSSGGTARGSFGGGSGGNPQGFFGDGSGGNAQGSFDEGSSGDAYGPAAGGSAGEHSGGAAGNSPANRYRDGNEGSREQTPLPEGVLNIRPPHEEQPSASEHGRSSSDEQGMVLRPGEWYPKETPPEKPAQEKWAKEKSAKRAKNAATTRGKDWGLPDAAAGSVPITRPIHVECEADRLVILPERGFSSGKEILLGPRTGEATDELVSAIWTRMQAWGIAGKGMYWRPVLHVRVAPNAAQRYEDLQMLLESSGLSIERKE